MWLDDRQVGGYELSVKEIELIHQSEEYPISNKEHGVDFLCRTDTCGCGLRSNGQNAYKKYYHLWDSQLLSAKGFVQMDAPFHSNACEGTTTLFHTDFYGEEAFFLNLVSYGEAMQWQWGRFIRLDQLFEQKNLRLVDIYQSLDDRAGNDFL